jgi:hypothetical protein
LLEICYDPLSDLLRSECRTFQEIGSLLPQCFGFPLFVREFARAFRCQCELVFLFRFSPTTGLVGVLSSTVERAQLRFILDIELLQYLIGSICFRSFHFITRISRKGLYRQLSGAACLLHSGRQVGLIQLLFLTGELDGFIGSDIRVKDESAVTGVGAGQTGFATSGTVFSKNAHSMGRSSFWFYTELNMAQTFED